MTGRLVVLDPTAEAPRETSGSLPRPVSLSGLAVGYLDNGKPNSDRFLRLLAARLREDGAQEAAWARKPSIGRVATDEMLDDLAAECDVVVTGVGDCAGCCSCTVRDAIALERRGVPAYVVCTSELVTTARIAARAAGVPDLPLTVIDHPLGSLTDDLLAARAEDASGQIRGRADR
ncbi:UGSC family (seleno)protein [Actinomadura sp. KC216]|uniref:UGSC family (seleno)protein n=1 Tax=Actinomadura sp. KC216 TaxID=2530370 RepID=UPI00140516D0|nr:UGSC family (seleno)protein [Actinomadura sp. KC216]